MKLCKQRGLVSVPATRHFGGTLRVTDLTMWRGGGVGRAVEGSTVKVAGVVIEHPLLHRRLPLAGDNRVFESYLSVSDPVYLSDHRVFDFAVFPASAMTELVFHLPISPLNAVAP